MKVPLTSFGARTTFHRENINKLGGLNKKRGGEMKRIATGLFMGLLVSLMTVTASGSLWAQATAQISGTVKDSSGAVLPGAEITATQTETGVSRMTISNETGQYVLPN